MATGGMGDTCLSMITSFVGQFDNLKEAVMSATYHIVLLAKTLQKICMWYHHQDLSMKYLTQ